MGEKEWHHIVTVEDLGELKKKVNITYDCIATEMAFNKACDIVSKQVAVNGFRKGKAPKRMVESAYPDKIREIAKSLLSQEGFMHACYEHKFIPLSEPNVEYADFQVDGTFSCDVILEVKPTIEPTGYLGLSLKKLDINLDEMTNQMLEEAKRQHMNETVNDEIKSGSHVTVDFWTLVDGEQISNGENQQIVVNEGQEPPLGQNLIGAKRGDMIKENIVMPEAIPEYGGKEAEVNVEIKMIHEKTLPSDEELVEKMKAPSYEELLKAIKQGAEIEANNRQRKSAEEEIIDKLIEMHEFEVPNNWVKDEEKYLEGQLNLANIDEEARKTINNLAERNVRRSFLLDSIYETEKELALTKEEFNNLMNAEAKRFGVTAAQLQKDLKEKNMLEGVVNMMKHRKVFDMIISNAQVGEDNLSQDLIVPESM